MNLCHDELTVDVLGVEFNLVAGFDRREHCGVLDAVDHGHAVVHVELFHRSMLDRYLAGGGVDLSDKTIGQFGLSPTMA